MSARCVAHIGTDPRAVVLLLGAPFNKHRPYDSEPSRVHISLLVALLAASCGYRHLFRALPGRQQSAMTRVPVLVVARPTSASLAATGILRAPRSAGSPFVLGHFTRTSQPTACEWRRPKHHNRCASFREASLRSPGHASSAGLPRSTLSWRKTTNHNALTDSRSICIGALPMTFAYIWSRPWSTLSGLDQGLLLALGVV